MVDTEKQQDTLYEDNSNMESIVEMFIAAVKISLFCYAVYSFKSVFSLMQEMFLIAKDSISTLLVFMGIPCFILFVIIFLIINHIKKI